MVAAGPLWQGDFPALGEIVEGFDDDAYDVASQAAAAWEAAVCWDDDYAIRRLAEVRAV